MKNALVLFFLYFSISNIYCARPTVQASNLTFASLRCNSVQLNWTNGNGSARIIVAREGAVPSYSPIDLTSYGANKKFAGGTQFGSGNYIVYNSTGSNFVVVDSLKPCTTYFFDIYEHDNNGSNTLYLLSSPASISIKTYCLKMAFDIKFNDSCEKKNGFQFTNNSVSDIPSVSYSWDFGDGNTSTTNPVVNHSYTNKVGKIQVRLIATPSLGCSNTAVNFARVYPRKNAFIDYKSFADTQCLDNNYFLVSPQPLASPNGLSYSFSYSWNFGDGTKDTSFSKMKKTYAKDGKFNVELEITLNFTNPPGSDPKKSGCRDTLRFDAFVLPSPVGSATINDTFQCLKNNLFNFSNSDNTLIFFKWYFGDNDSSNLQSVSHIYSDTGTYKVMHVAFASTGCKGRDTVTVKVGPNLNSNFTGLDTFYCSSKNPVVLNPAAKFGIFKDYPFSIPNTIIPEIPGNYKVSHIVKNIYCQDTTIKFFRVQANPKPALGKDSSICAGANVDLSANDVGLYLWNTGETTPTISIFTTGQYNLKVTNGKCSAIDSINILFSSVPKIELGKDTIICKGAAVILKATCFNCSHAWNSGSTDSIIYAYNQGKYFVKASNSCGTAEDSIFVSVQAEYCDLFMANAFSPDNDLNNAVFTPRGRNISVKLFQVFNRWGELIFQSEKDNEGWNGRYKDVPCEQGFYFWKLFYTTPAGDKIKKSNAFGSVLLLR